MFALIVSVRVKPEERERFLEAIEDDATCSVRDEPGCLRFDVLQDREDADGYYFYEVYADEVAFQAHGLAPHFARWDAASRIVLAEPARVVRTAGLFPDPYR